MFADNFQALVKIRAKEGIGNLSRTMGPVEFIYRVIKHGDKAIGLLGRVMPALKGRPAESK